MSRQLVVIDGPEAGRTIPLEDGERVTIGRGQASAAQLNDPRISRVHCSVDVGPQVTTLNDEGSTGGTFVAGKQITQHRLSHGDEIRIGDTRIRYDSVEPLTALHEAPQATGASPNLLEELLGQTMGHFRLERIHHTGAASVLFQATDEKHTRPVMVKVMLPNVMSEDKQRDRFVRAVHTMISVRHENLVEVYGAGQKGQFCWCAMEYVDGVSVLEIIEAVGTGGRLDWREAYHVAVHVARALECADKRKVVHRNITPKNLLQRRTDKVVKLCDLMLAKALEGTQAREVTAPGQLVGDISYMSPERMNDTGKLDWRSDQYSLGATLFALLTGKPPFQANSVQSMVQTVRTESPVFPEQVQQETNPAFQQVILKMLGKSPEDRFAQPAELLQALSEIGNDCNVQSDSSTDQ